MSVSPQQFQRYQQQWVEPVQDNDAAGQEKKRKASFWVAYCHLLGTGGVAMDRRVATQMLEHVIQEQDNKNSNAADNEEAVKDLTGKHRFRLAGIMGLSRMQEAEQLYRQAVPRLQYEAQLDDCEDASLAAYYLGYCLFFGYSMEQDRLGGIHWWKLAAEKGHADAQLKLGIDGFTNFTSVEQASLFQWWQSLAETQEEECAWVQEMLGLCYENGCGVEKDLIKAVERYNKAIAQGDDENSVGHKERLLSELEPEERKHVLSCVNRNQKMEKANQLVRQDGNDLPFGLWAHALRAFQSKDEQHWEAPSPSLLSLHAIVQQL